MVTIKLMKEGEPKSVNQSIKQTIKQTKKKGKNCKNGLTR